MAPHRLNYADGGVKTRRESRLAAIAVVVSFLSCPFISGPLFNIAGKYVPLEGRLPSLVFGSMVAGTALSIGAVVRIRVSDGGRSGMDLAVAAIVMSGIWWAAICAGWALLQNVAAIGPAN